MHPLYLATPHLPVTQGECSQGQAVGYFYHPQQGSAIPPTSSGWMVLDGAELYVPRSCTLRPLALPFIRSDLFIAWCNASCEHGMIYPVPVNNAVTSSVYLTHAARRRIANRAAVLNEHARTNARTHAHAHTWLRAIASGIRRVAKLQVAARGKLPLRRPKSFSNLALRLLLQLQLLHRHRPRTPLGRRLPWQMLQSGRRRWRV